MDRKKGTWTRTDEDQGTYDMCKRRCKMDKVLKDMDREKGTWADED